MTPADRRVIAAQEELLGAVLDMAADPELYRVLSVTLVEELAALDPYLAATNQETCTQALEAGDPLRLYAAVLRAGAQHAQLDLSGQRP